MNKPFLLFLLAAAFAGTAPGQSFEFGVFGGIHRISSSQLGSISPTARKDDDTRIRGRNGAGVRLTWNTPGYYGHEVGVMQSSARLNSVFRETVNRATVETPLEDKIKVHTGFYNFLIYFMPSGEKWRPFITGGLQMTQYQAPSFERWTRPRARNYGANYGAGLKLLPSKHFILRLDWRHYLSGKPFDLEFANFQRTGGLLPTMEASVGISFGF